MNEGVTRRAFVGGAATAGAGILISGSASARRVPGAQDPAAGSIFGYADPLSVRPGEDLHLFVSTDAPKFRVEFYRLGPTLAGPLDHQRTIHVGTSAPAGGPADDWGWPGYAFAIPKRWESGVYVAMLVEVAVNGVDIPNQPLDRTTPDGDDRKAMFVVRPRSGSENQILFKVPTATYAAYNYAGGGSTYGGTVADTTNIASLRRPGLGTGGPTVDTTIDVYDPSSNRQKLAHWEAPFIRWLESNGYLVDYCSDFDLHFDDTLLDPYALLLSTGHDEYWSDDMMDAAMIMLRRGGNVAFFSGNTIFRHITFPSDWQMQTRQSPAPFPNDVRHRDGFRLEDGLTGVSYWWGNGRWDSLRQVVGYSLQITDHWILDGVGDGVLGDAHPDNGDPEGLIGYECDGAPAVKRNGILVPKGSPTPPDFLILGQARLDGTWENGGMGGVNVCTMGLHANRGVSFTAGTVDWARVLASGREPRVETLTRNVLDGLSIAEPAEWATMGGQITSMPGLGINLDGRLELFARGYDGFARHVSQIAPNGDWADWASEDGTLAGDGNTETVVSMARNQDGTLQLFARFSDNSIRYLVQNAPNGTFAPWVSLGGTAAGDPVAAENAAGRLEVFVISSDGTLRQKRQEGHDGSWSAWSNLRGQLHGRLSVARNSDGRLEVFARGDDNAIWHIAQTSPGGDWARWQSLRGVAAGDPVAAQDADGRLEVFVRGGGNTLRHARQNTPGGDWSTWANRGGKLASNPAVARNLDGRLEVFVLGPGNGVWRLAQIGRNDGWTGWSTLGGTFIGSPAVFANSDGRLTIFIRGPQRAVWHRRQLTPGNW